MASLRDLASNLGAAESIRPAVHSGSVDGQSVDTRGYDSAAAFVTVGAIAGSGNVTVKLQDSPDNTNWTDVAAANLQGEFPAALLTNTAFLVGYLGTERYVRAVGTLNSGTSVAFSVGIVLGNPNIRPR